MQLSAFADCLSKRLPGEGPAACALWKLGYSLLFIVFVLSWDWKKRQTFVLSFDGNVGNCREPQVTGTRSWISLAHALERMLSCKRCAQFNSRDAKKRPKQVALVSKYASLHNFLGAAVYKARPRTLCFRKC